MEQVDPDSHVVQPVHPIPPHCDHLLCGPDGQLDVAVVVVGGTLVLEEDEVVELVGGGGVVLDLEVEIGTEAEVEDGVVAHPETVLHCSGRLRELLPT